MLSKWQLPPSSPVHTDLTEHGLGGLEGKRRILEPEGLWDSSLVLGGIHLKESCNFPHPSVSSNGGNHSSSAWRKEKMN